MAIIRPFKGLRPDPRVAHLVASVPYDVVNRKEAAELAKDNPISFLRVTRSEIELDESTDAYSNEVYQKANTNMQRLIQEAPLIEDEQDRFYIYRLIWKDVTQVGIAATFSVEDYNNDIIMKHEKTRRAKEDDRTNHIVTTNVQTGAVFLTYKGIDDINDLVEKTIRNEEPIYNFTTPDKVTHTIWVMPKEANDIIVFEIGKAEHLYIADGHHRAASASRAQKVKMEENPNHTGKEEYNFLMAVLFPAEQLKILPYNRVVFELNNLTNESFLEKVKASFTIEASEISSPNEKGKIGMFLDKKWYMLTPNENVVPGEAAGDKLDVSILQDFLLAPVLGILDQRTDNNIDFIGGIRGTEELEKLVNSGAAKVAFSMYPVSVNDLINISEVGETMPPKSTWFEPKLRDGLVVHKI
ncbi:MAG: hypothetical protein COW71_06035 [Ignavibacteriales bacterium CG18_big_fil_WC_8_21_14_2_50_31_20]|nr:MAG: hypothetical protein COW71_06035 [Ignavibacteriales bacterium CG18_big_fil_WC_8_21_14_2_50_31_20]